MTLPVPTLDHVVINARDEMDHAADVYRRLGIAHTIRNLAVHQPAIHTAAAPAAR